MAGLGAAIATRLAYRIIRKTPSAHSNTGFKYGQAFTASLVALAHGTSDGQKTMGVITLVLIAANLGSGLVRFFAFRTAMRTRARAAHPASSGPD